MKYTLASGKISASLKYATDLTDHVLTPTALMYDLLFGLFDYFHVQNILDYSTLIVFRLHAYSLLLLVE